jgi:cell division protein FtsI (penicillin-binding protein 3)
MKIEDTHIPYRLYFVALVFFMVALGIVFRMANIQLTEGDKYKALAKEKSVKEIVIEANKGNVYSSDGSLLATSIPKYDIRFDAMAPSKDNFKANYKALADSLSRMFNKPKSHYEKILKRARAKKNRYCLIARNLGYTQYVTIKSFPLFNLGVNKGGIITEYKTVREHPMGSIADRTIGYERKSKDKKLTRIGIEGAFHSYLNGENGRKLVQKIAKNQWKPISDKNEIEPKDGADVIATIDVYIQDIAHHALLKQLEYYKADHGCVVVMETKTGEVKAISNLGRGAGGAYTETVNYAVSESHEPGSTFKLLSLLSVLEDKVADTGTVYNTNGGEIVIYGKRVRDSKKGGYGQISLAKGFELSSNTAIVQAVYQNYKNNPQKFVDRLNSFGLNKPLGLPFKGEGKSYIPQPNSNRWSGLSLPWMAYGYGVSMTPLQTLTVYNAIANNGEMIKPHFVREIKEWDRIIKKFDKEVIHPKICSQETILKLKAVMENVVKRGTGSKLFSKNFSMAGKTGTAQVNYGKGKEDMYYASSFVGYFPADEPKYSCIVVVHKPDASTGYYGADVAGPVFLKIAQKIFTDSPRSVAIKGLAKGYKFQNTSYAKYDQMVNKHFDLIPNVVGLPGMDALALLENLGVKVKLTGVGKVRKQSLNPGEKLYKNQIITLELS